MKTKSLLNLLLIFFSIAVSAQAQILDPSFGESGIASKTYEPFIQTIVKDASIQKDGKILQVIEKFDGSFYYYNLIRLTRDGLLDSTFGSNGVVSSPLNSQIGTEGIDQLNFVKLLFLPDDSYMFVWGNEAVNFSKFTIDGTTDNTFGAKGEFSKNLGQLGTSGPKAASVAKNGITIAYSKRTEGSGFNDRVDVFVIKFDFGGQRDRDFGRNGFFIQAAVQFSRTFGRFIVDMRTRKDGDIIVKNSIISGGLNVQNLRTQLILVSSEGQLKNIYSGSIFSKDFFSDYAFNDKGELFLAEDNNIITKLNSSLEKDDSFKSMIPENFNSDLTYNNRQIVVTQDNLITVSEKMGNTIRYVQLDSMGNPQTDFGLNGVSTVNLEPFINTSANTRPNINSNTFLLAQKTKSIGVYSALNQTITLRLDGKNEPQIVTDFNLINGSTNRVLKKLNKGGKYAINLLEKNYLNFQLKADIDEDSKSYKLTLEGPVTFSRIENAAPYALFGDTNGDYFGKPLLEGTYTLSATPFSERDAKGMKGAIKTITFEIVDTAPRITDVLLSTFNPNGTLLSNTSLEPGSSIIEPQGTTFNIEALANRFTSSVRLELTGGPNDISRLENVSPFALFGDVSGIFNQEALAPGTYVFSATPYTQQLARGFQGPTKVISFTVENMPTPNSIVIAPNPIQGSEINLTFDTTNASNIVSYEVVDLTGRNILSGTIQLRAGQKTYSISTSEIDMKPGVYTLRMNNTTYSLIK